MRNTLELTWRSGTAVEVAHLTQGKEEGSGAEGVGEEERGAKEK
jgi:hypothetical protein